MNLLYHRSVQGDVSAVLNYYDEVGGPALGDAFFEEFMVYVALALEHPTRFHPIEGDLRRANLDRFPYHFLYRIQGDTIRILVSGITSAIRDTGSSGGRHTLGEGGSSGRLALPRHADKRRPYISNQPVRLVRHRLGDGGSAGSTSRRGSESAPYPSRLCASA